MTAEQLVVLLHGLAGSAREMTPPAEAITADGYRVVAPCTWIGRRLPPG